MVDQTNDLINNIVNQLKGLAGLEAVVLGGSRARGTHNTESDIDLGLYYLQEQPIDRIKLAKAAEALDDMHRTEIITGIGEWGPWINGGGWLKVLGTAVDFLYRDLSKVDAIVQECLSGKIDIDYQPGHPHGFCSSIYLGELMLCQPLWDPNNRIAMMKAAVPEYPDSLQKAIIDKFLWEVDFSLINAGKGVVKRDISYVSGHLFRAVSCLTQVIFAINRQYLINEKGAVAFCSRLDKCPKRFEERVQSAFSLLSFDQINLHKGIENINLLKEEVLELC